MDEEIDSLLIDVRANTQGFAADIAAMRGTMDAGLVDGFARAGTVLERGLLSAIRRGSLGFDDLGRIALRTIDQIAAQALQAGIGSLFGGGPGGGSASGPGGGLGGFLGNLAGALLGLPGRATGGPVAPGSAYLVGEHGPEVFVPTSAGRVETGTAPRRDVRVAIQIATPRGDTVPTAMRRSARQVASSVRRALDV